MERYEKYKPSGIEWIGEFPEHWEALSLKHCVRTKITDGPHETPEFITEGVPFVSVEAIQNGTINFDSVRGYISEEEDKRFTLKCKPQKDDIFIVKSGSTTGKIGYVHTSKNFNIWSPLALVRVKETYSSKYFYHFLQSDLFFTQVQLFWSFGTQPNIGMNVLENLKIVVPIAEEQSTIAAYLDRKTTEIGQIIANKQKLIALYEEEKQAVINHAVTRGVDPNVRLKPSGVEWLGGIPEHWKVKRLKTLVSKIGSGVTPSGGANVYQLSGIPLLRSQNIYFDGLRLDDVAYISDEIDENMSNSRIQDNDVLLNITGGSIGRCYFVPENFGKGNVNQHVCILRPIAQKIDTKFLYFLLRSNVGQLQIDLLQTGANREGLNFEQLKNFIIPYMPFKTQKSIVGHMELECNRFDVLIEKCKKQIELLKEYRTTLISEVVTGKVKVV